MSISSARNSDGGAPKHESYMQTRVSYKPGSKKAYTPGNPIERAKQRNEELKQKLEEQKERDKQAAEAAAQRNKSDVQSAWQQCEALQERATRTLILSYLGITEDDYANANSGKKASTETTSTEGTSTTTESSGTLATRSAKEQQYQELINKYAAQYNLDPNLVAAVITIESAWNPSAVSSANCQGLMQVNPRYVSGNLKDPEHNIQEGCRILRECIDAYPESLDHALTAYNRGIAGARNVPTSDYATKVQDEYNSRKQLAQSNSGSGSGSNLDTYA